MKVIQLYKNETKLIEASIENNRDAQRILYETYAPKMLSVCRSYITDLQYAEDVMVNGFCKVFSHLKSFKNEGSFEGWIRRIMVRESIDFLRKRKDIEFPVEEMHQEKHLQGYADLDIGISEMQQLIDELPEGYRVVFVMFAIEGYKHHEIAELLNISEGTSKSQLFKARKLLQEKLNQINTASYGTK
ncbi:RNA polymerase sigma factor [Flavobacteriaceae bacterium XHP0103]|nr:RNA polymerase sigma factor [Marixanthotalea marina]